jgi:hypothetical protein
MNAFTPRMRGAAVVVALMACGSARVPAQDQPRREAGDAIALVRLGMPDSALKLLARVPPSVRDAAIETSRALALTAMGRRYAADSAVRRAVVFGADSAPPGAAADLVAAWRAARLGVPRVDSVVMGAPGERDRTRDVPLRVVLSARDGSHPRGRAAWWLAIDGRTDTLCVASADATCAWDGMVRGTRVAAGSARLGVSVSTSDLDIPVVAERAVVLRWEAPPPVPPPAVLPETVVVVQRDLDRRARWWRAAAVAGATGAVAMGVVAARAGAWSVDTPTDAAIRGVASAVYVSGAVALGAATLAAGWSTVRPWSRSSRFVRPDVVATNAARRAAWERDEAARAAGDARLRVEVLP